MVIEKLIDFIESCPLLEEFNVKTDYCAEDAISYCIEVSPSAKTLNTYIDGSKEQQLSFTFSSKEVMSDYDDTNMYNTIFYEKFAKWIEEQNMYGNLPLLDDGYESISIEVISHGYVIQSESDRGRYVMQMKFKYFER